MVDLQSTALPLGYAALAKGMDALRRTEILPLLPNRTTDPPFYPNTDTERSPRAACSMSNPSKLTRLALVLAIAWALGCASVPDDIAPAAGLVTAIPLDPVRVASLQDGEELIYDVRVGPLHVADIRYRVRRFESRGIPWVAIDGITQMSGIAGTLSNAGGTVRAVISPETFLPVTSIWTTTAKRPKSRAVAFSHDGNSADAAMWSETWVDTAHLKGASLFDPVSSVYLLRVIDPPQLGEEIRTLMVEGTALHLMTVRREVIEPQEPDTPKFIRLSLRSDAVDRDSGNLLGETPKTRLFVDVEAVPPYRILRMEGKIAFGSVIVTLDPHAKSPPSR